MENFEKRGYVDYAVKFIVLQVKGKVVDHPNLLYQWKSIKKGQGILQGKLGKAGDLLGVAGDEFSPGSLDTLYKPYIGWRK